MKKKSLVGKVFGGLLGHETNDKSVADLEKYYRGNHIKTSVERKIHEVENQQCLLDELNDDTIIHETAKSNVFCKQYINQSFLNVSNLEQLIVRKPDFKTRSGETFKWAIRAANKSNSMEVLIKLKELKCRIHSKRDQALLWAIPNKKIFAYLVEKFNFDPNKCNAFNDACMLEKKDIVEYLIFNDLCTSYDIPSTISDELVSYINTIKMAHKLNTNLPDSMTIEKAVKI